MTINFYSGIFLKTWPNWSGEIPQIGDTVWLHFGDNNEEEEKYNVVGRTIDGTKPDTIRIDLEWIDKPLLEDTVAFQKGVEEGRRLERQEFQKVEGGWTDSWETSKGEKYAMGFEFDEELELPAEIYVKKV